MILFRKIVPRNEVVGRRNCYVLEMFPSKYILKIIILKLLRDINLQAQVRRHKFGCNIDLSVELKDGSINHAIALKLYILS